ncbi:MAG: hypothetical protein IT260_07830 [Saprospiraceae bacterium]|nr:hypothetical protein [Saprospiraceae bacterium]
MTHNQIIPECFADTLLVKILGFHRANHQGGIGRVLKVLEQNFKNRPSVGIVDDDKTTPKDLDQFVVVEEREKVRKLCKPNSQHVILVVSPAFEDWVFENAKAVQVNPEQYGFRTRKYFREVCKSPNVDHNQQIKQFLNTLKQKDAPGFCQLKDWICDAAGIDKNQV